MSTLSLGLICRDEVGRLPEWLAANAGSADEIVAVDSGSTDGTVEMLERHGARVAYRGWTGYADQRNHAAEMCTGDWVLFLDADEYMDDQLVLALQDLKSRTVQESGFMLLRRWVFQGRALRHGGFGDEPRLRLIRRGRGRWVGRRVHEHLEVEGEVGRLPGRLLHHSYKGVEDYLERMRRYAEQAARQMAARGQRATPLKGASHAWWSFFLSYFLRAGFLDGWAGYLAARLESMYTLTKYARLIELNQEDPR